MRILVTLLVLCLSVFTLAQRQDNARSQAIQVLRQMRTSSTKVKFAGIRNSYFKTKDSYKRSKEYVLRANGKTRIDYDSKSDFAGQIVYEIGDKRYTYTKASNELKQGRRMALIDQLFAMRSDQDSRDRKVYADGDFKVIGRSCHKLVAEMARGKMHVFVDKSEYVVLKQDMYDKSGVKIAGYSYSKIDFKPRIDESKLSPPTNAKVVTSYDSLTREAKKVGMTPYYFDSTTGWNLASTTSFKSGSTTVLRTFYTKNRSRITLAQVPKTADVSDLRKIVPNGMQSYVWDEGRYKLILVGNVSADDLRQLSRLVRLKKQEPLP